MLLALILNFFMSNCLLNSSSLPISPQVFSPTINCIHCDDDDDDGDDNAAYIFYTHINQ